MKSSDLHPELAPVYRFTPNPPIGSPIGRTIIRRGIGMLKPPAIPDDVRLEQIALHGSPGLHVFSPRSGGNAAALFYIHGGGMVIGSPLQDYPLAIELVQNLGITVALAGYRLAPEHPFPTPLDDCEKGWLWLLAEASDRGIDTSRLAVGGQSAGGGLAAMLVQRTHDRGGILPTAQWLFCPMLDDRTAADRSLDAVRHRLWNNRSNRIGWTSLLGTEPGGASAPNGAAPSRRTDLVGLPATWIGTGTAELFHHEDVAYAQALRSAGVDVTLDEVAGAPHAFETIGRKTQVAKDYRSRAQVWLSRSLDIPRQPSPAPRAINE